MVHLVRGKSAARWIDEKYRLSLLPERPLCSIVTVGEALHLATRNNWGESKRETLKQLLSNIVVVQLGVRGVVDHYGRLGTYAEHMGQRMEQNDLWIAATTAATGSILLTTDTGFDVLHPSHVERIYIDPSGLPRDS